MSVPDPTATVAGNIRALRTQRGWSVRVLSERLGAAGFRMERSPIASLENGRRGIVTVAELYAFACIFGVSAQRLLEGPICMACADFPPAGFACLTCGKGSA